MSLIEEQGLRLLLNIPESLRKKLFVESGLDTNCKFVLAHLYYLDSRDSLQTYRTELPRQTGLSWSQCEACLQLLAQRQVIEYTSSGVRLKVKPLTYS